MKQQLINNKDISQFQERLVSLYLRLNGYLQSGFIPHSNNWGNVGTDIDRIGIRFPNHSQDDREVDCSPLLMIPENSIDIIIGEVKNNSLSFNNTLTETDNNAERNWGQILKWLGLFSTDEINLLIPKLIDSVRKNGSPVNEKFEIITSNNKFGEITIRPILFAIEKDKSQENTKLWINGDEINAYIWECFCPEEPRDNCSTRYSFELWGTEFFDIVKYFKDKHKEGKSIGTLEEMYEKLVK
jgi:hypothetical protein